jgi:hypothetical protein
LNEIPGIQYTEAGNALIIDATAPLTSPNEIFVTASNNNVSSSFRIALDTFVYSNVPLNTDFFNLSTTVDTNDTVDGFSDAVVSDPSLLSPYNAIDFSDSQIKYVGDHATFSTRVFNMTPILKLDLSGLTF